MGSMVAADATSIDAEGNAPGRARSCSMCRWTSRPAMATRRARDNHSHISQAALATTASQSTIPIQAYG